jgi:hypothetical protein
VNFKTPGKGGGGGRERGERLQGLPLQDYAKKRKEREEGGEGEGGGEKPFYKDEQAITTLTVSVSLTGLTS